MPVATPILWCENVIRDAIYDLVGRVSDFAVLALKRYNRTMPRALGRGLVVHMHVFCEWLPVLVLHDEACTVVFDRPGQREGGAPSCE